MTISKVTTERLKQIASGNAFTCTQDDESASMAAELLAVREAQSVPAPIAFSENADADKCRAWAWEQVKKDVTTDSWTVGDSCNFYGFYCWGWDMRRQYNEQRPPAVPDGYKLVPIEMTDEIGEAIAMEANCCGGIALDIYNAALAAAPTPTK